MMYVFQVGDYIAFNRIVQNERAFSFRTDFSTGKAIVTPAIPEQILPQGGEGQIVSIAKKLRVVGGEKFRVGRAVAGKPLGTVTVILDDAVLVAKQESLFDMAPVVEAGRNVYSGDAKGIA